jgi:ATP-dependent protease ClpP protease subunit
MAKAPNTHKTTPEVLLYGIIGQGKDCVSAYDFVSKIKALENDHPLINVRINSGGGSIFDGIAMYNAIKGSKATINTYVDGVAASMASVVALAGNKCYMSSLGKMMTHRAKGAITGGADDMRNSAQLLDSLEKTMAILYAEKTGLTEDVAKATFMGNEDKWMTAQEALDNKLIDGIFDATAQVSLPSSLNNLTEVVNAYAAALYNPDNNMEKLQLTANQLSALQLKAESTPAEMMSAIDALIQKAASVPTLQASVEAKDTEIANLKKEATKKDIEGYVAEALSAKKITVELGNTLKAQFADNPVGLKAVLDAMPSYSPITAQMQAGAEANELQKLEAKSFDELDKAGELPRLKELSIDSFKAKFKQHFNAEYKH